jgi:autotransporter-associated beta strand protein
MFGGARINGNHNINFTANRSIQGMQVTTSQNLNFQSGTTSNFTLSLGAGGLQIDSSAGAVSIASTMGVTLNGSQSWINNSTKTLSLDSAIGSLAIGSTVAGTVFTLGGTGNIQMNRGIMDGTGTVSVIKTGSGELNLARSNSYSGTTDVNAGTLYAGFLGLNGTGTGQVTVASGATIAGSGTVRGPFIAQNGASVQVGDSLATSDINTLIFDASAAMDFQSGSITTLGLDPTASNFAGLTSDKLDFTGSSGSLKFDGNLTITAPGFAPTAAATFDLLDWTGSMSSTFNSRFLASSYGGLILGNGDDNLGFDLPDVSTSGYGWDISGLSTNGSISLVAVPEPRVAGLAALGLLGLMRRRR